jgi:hypothetical protein
VLESKTKLKIFKNFKERTGGAVMKGAGSWAIEGLSGGSLLAARANGFVLFWDWETGEIVRRIEVDATNVGGAIDSMTISDVVRSTGLDPEALWSSRLKIRSTSSGLIRRRTMQGWRVELRSETKVLKTPLRSSPTSMRGEGKYLRIDGR